MSSPWRVRNSFNGRTGGKACWVSVSRGCINWYRYASLQQTSFMRLAFSDIRCCLSPMTQRNHEGSFPSQRKMSAIPVWKRVWIIAEQPSPPPWYVLPLTQNIVVPLAIIELAPLYHNTSSFCSSSSRRYSSMTAARNVQMRNGLNCKGPDN